MPFPRRLCTWLGSSALLLPALAVPSALLADDEPPDSRLSIHGYLTQAYADVRGDALLGIPEGGTTDYRTAALQLRYAVTAKDNFVIQLSHERFGESPFAELKDDVEIDWVFYERRFSDATSLRVGKVQIPLGIYNEIRDVGTLLPLYRPPFNFYGEGAFTSETVDGFVLSHEVHGGAWSLDADLYYGGWDIIEVEPATNRVSEGRVTDQIGVQLWASTPVPGLRVGGGITRFDLRDELLSGGQSKEELREWNLGVDGSFERFLVRAEYLFVDFPPGDYRAWYVQLGARCGERLQIVAQGDFSRLRFSLAPLLPVAFDEPFQEDLALAVSWSFRSNLVAKLEAHRAEGYRFDQPVNLFVEPALEGRYYIASLSTSF